jgi:hypothetical protein
MGRWPSTRVWVEGTWVDCLCDLFLFRLIPRTAPAVEPSSKARSKRDVVAKSASASGEAVWAFDEHLAKRFLISLDVDAEAVVSLDDLELAYDLFHSIHLPYLKLFLQRSCRLLRSLNHRLVKEV